MHEIAALLLTLLLVPVASIVPGLWLASRLNWSPTERLYAAVAFSQIILYFASAAVYLTGAGNAGAWVVMLLACAMLATNLAHLRKLFTHHATRHTLSALLTVTLGSLVFMAGIRVYSGGGWGVDWLEHYQRSRFFAEHWPVRTLLCGYLLPARPPMMNLVDSLLLMTAGRLSGMSFVVYQVSMVLLSALVVLPCALWVSLLRGRLRHHGWLALLAALLLINPAISNNMTYPWTKLYAAFFILGSLWFYLRGWRKNDSKRMIFAVALMAAACVAHYSAGPYALLLTVHYLVAVVPKRGWPARGQAMREISAGLLVTALLLGSWVGWSIANYGIKATTSSNSSAMENKAMTLAQSAQSISSNLIASLVPHPLRSSYAHWLESSLTTQRNPLGLVRDYLFTIYQTTLPASIGSVAGLVVIAWWAWSVLRRAEPAPIRRFWAWFIAGGYVLGVAVHGGHQLPGVAHVCLQPLTLLGLCVIAARAPAWPLTVRVLLVAGALLDLLAGTLLHLSMQAFDAGILLGKVGGKAWVTSLDGMPLMAINSALDMKTMKLTTLASLLHSQGPTAVILATIVGVLGWYVVARSLLKPRCK